MNTKEIMTNQILNGKTMNSIYDKLSEERKLLQSKELVPEWYTTAGFQLFKEKYDYQTNGRSVRGRFEAISKTAASYLPESMKEEYETKFFELMWNGWLSPSTPILANMGTNRCMPVSCSGTIVEDSIDGFFKNLHEVACLSKQGFGTASDLSNIRPRGSAINDGGKANGVMPVIEDHITAIRHVHQGNRRGAWSAYLDIEHGDFWEVINYLATYPDDINIGWNIKQSFIDKLQNKDTEAKARYRKALKVKRITGKGYFFFVDKANAKRPIWYKEKGLEIKNSQLCNEIVLFNDYEHTYSCILASMNALKWNEWKNTHAPFTAIVFLDCVAEDFIQKAKNKPGMKKVIRFTEKSRALGLGLCGLHTLFMQERLPFESLQAYLLSNEISKHIREEAEKATEYLAEILGVPEFCHPYKRRNSHLIAVAPTKSTALLMGGVSEGINPDPAMAYTQTSAGGEVARVNPVLLGIMKERNIYNSNTIMDIINNHGSIQHVSWLDEHEKKVFKTAFEINQEALLRMAKGRSKYIDQWMSLNLFFGENESSQYISEIHKKAFLDPDILGMYYIYTKTGIQASKGECEVCQ